MLIVGEVRTCLLRNSTGLTPLAVVDLLNIKQGERVKVTERPVIRSVSPAMLDPVDCRLATAPAVKARGIGTVASTAVVTGRLVLQASARTRFERAAATNRRAWSHYKAKRGVVEVISLAEVAQLARGHRAEARDQTALDLGSISQRLINLIQRRPQLDHQIVIRARPTRLRWTATTGDGPPSVRLHMNNEELRTVELTLPEGLLPAADRFCEDLALHDWLITTVSSAIDQADQEKARDEDPLDTLTAALDRLVHLWMPGAHVDPALHGLWQALEISAGFSRQWNSQVARIRDMISVGTLDVIKRSKLQETW